jgi:hypothetical protein
MSVGNSPETWAYFQTVPAGTAVSATTSATFTDVTGAGLATVMGGVPITGTPVFTTIVNGVSGNLFGGLTPGGGPFTVAAGQSLLAYIYGQASSGVGVTGTDVTSVADNQGNTWEQVGFQVTSGKDTGSNTWWANSIALWFCANPIASTSYSFTISGSNPAHGTNTGTVFIVAATNIAAVQGRPTFRKLVSADLPSGGGGSGVSSLNSLTGALSIVAGTGISVTPSGSNITIANTSTLNFADSETPSGSTPGTSFTLAHTPSPAASLQLFLNGQLLKSGGVDYTLSGAGITTVLTVAAADVLLAWYRY